MLALSTQPIFANITNWVLWTSVDSLTPHTHIKTQLFSGVRSLTVPCQKLDCAII